MTIHDAARSGLCADCMFRQVGPGPFICLGASLGDKECPGRAVSEKRQGNRGKQ